MPGYTYVECGSRKSTRVAELMHDKNWVGVEASPLLRVSCIQTTIRRTRHICLITARKGMNSEKGGSKFFSENIQVYRHLG